MQELTGFDRKTINTVLSELFNIGAIYEIEDTEEYRVAKDLYIEYRNYYTDDRRGDKPTVLKVKSEDQTSTVRAFQAWLALKNISNVNHHVFIEGGRLNDLANHLVENVRTELLIVNPYVGKANILNEMKGRAQKGVKIKILTRFPEVGDKQEFIQNLQGYGVEVFTNPSVHAKIMVFDRGVAIVSSMNLYASSLAGASWEAGIATSSTEVVNKILTSVTQKFEEKETTGLEGQNKPI